MTFQLGVDIGGTFTDFALIDQDSGAVSIHKVLTTPRDPSVAVLDGARDLLARGGCPIDQVATIVHGTTLVTNATIERKGAVTGMLVTAGFRDALDIAKEQRYEVSDLRLRFPAPVVPRPLRREVTERIGFDGRVETALAIDEVRTHVTALRGQHAIEAIAICFLHSYANPSHEQAVRKLIEAEFPELYLSVSSEVCPFIREFERWTTTTVNAYTQPMVDGYLRSLERGLAALGFRGEFFVMTSNGGIANPEVARRFPVRLIESGPVAGALMSAYHSRLLDQPNILSFDMGGTTAKGAIIRDHVPMRRDEVEVAHVYGFRKGSGLPLKVPVVDMIEIGAGGGSIARADPRGVIATGPDSAGADPGPACYGLGGEDATLTDANLVLGYLDPEFFLGGEMSLSPGKAEDAIRATVSDRIGLDVLRAAWGIHETINEEVARAFRVHAARRGFDYRSSSMVAFGGSGPIHALRIAAKLRIPRVIFPAGAGVMSAIGLLASPVNFETVRTEYVALADITADTFAAKFEAMARQVTEYVAMAGVPASDIVVNLRLDMRYVGQGYEIEVALPKGGGPREHFKDLPTLFAENYQQVFSTSFGDWPTEIVNWKVEATGPVPELGNEGYELGAYGAENGTQALKGTRRAYVHDEAGYVECPVYDRYALDRGTVLDGPALIEENESTCVIDVGNRVVVDDRYNLVAEVAAG